jgi:hypothetical protein
MRGVIKLALRLEGSGTQAEERAFRDALCCAVLCCVLGSLILEELK